LQFSAQFAPAFGFLLFCEGHGFDLPLRPAGAAKVYSLKQVLTGKNLDCQYAQEPMDVWFRTDERVIVALSFAGFGRRTNGKFMNGAPCGITAPSQQAV